MLQVVDGFLTDQQCDWFVELFHQHPNLGSPGASGRGPIQVVDLVNLYSAYKEIQFLFAACARQSPVENSFVDYMQVVQRGAGNSLNTHFDFEDTVYSGVVVLNDDFEGGETFVGDEIIEPKKGRGMFFYGSTVQHGLNMIYEGDRYTIASWFRDTKEVSEEKIAIAREREATVLPSWQETHRGTALFEDFEPMVMREAEGRRE
jgi:hypothetical protein